jgi:hypothetical protein
MRVPLLPLGVIGAAAVGLLLLTGAGSGSRVSPEASATFDAVGQRVTERIDVPGLGRVVAAMFHVMQERLGYFKATDFESMLVSAGTTVDKLSRIYKEKVQASQAIAGGGATPISWRALLLAYFDKYTNVKPLEVEKLLVEPTLARANIVGTSPADFSKAPEHAVPYLKS